MNGFKAGFAAAAVLVLAGIGFAGGTRTTAPDVWATCVVNAAEPTRLFEEARAATNQVGSCIQWDGGIPRWGRPAVGADTEAARAALAKLAGDQIEYRRGRYAALLPEGAPSAAPTALAAVGMHLEEVAATRLRALGCGQVPAAEMSLVSGYDPMFAAAAVGRYVQPGDLSTVQAVAAAVLDRAREEALARARALPNAVCEQDWRTEYSTHAKEWGQFAAGEHPWAPGCRVREDGADLVLRCE